MDISSDLRDNYFNAADELHDRATANHHGALLNFKLVLDLLMESFEKYNERFYDNDLLMATKINAKKNDLDKFFNLFITNEEDIIKGSARLLQQNHETDLSNDYIKKRLLVNISMVPEFQEKLFGIFFSDDEELED
jgi:hypothetical protein